MAISDYLEARVIHRTLAPVVGTLLCLLTVTGVVWTILRKWFGLTKDQTRILMTIHKLDLFHLSYIFSPLFALLCLIFFFTGVSLTRVWRKRELPTLNDIREADSARTYHRLVALIAFIPLLLAALTGAGYVICRKWFLMEKDKVHWIIELHNMQIVYMSYGYPLFLALLAITMTGTGLPLTTIWRWIGRKWADWRRDKDSYDMVVEVVEGAIEFDELTERDHATDDGAIGDSKANLVTATSETNHII